MAGATSFIELILKKLGDDAAKVAVPAAGLLAAGQSEDADAGFVTRGGKTLLEAWHGSPHKFDKFSMDQIGTGEGAQAYGHGLYFADSEDVARQYRDTLSLNGYQDNNANYSKALELGLSAGEFDRFEGMVRMAATKDGLDAGRISADLQEYLQWPDDSMPALESFVGDYLNTLPKGHLYRTEIDVTPESLLDWDAMLDEQPKAVQEALESSDWWDYAAGDLYSYEDNPNGGNLVRWLSEDGPEFGSQQLNDAGIKGIKYLDGDSRSVGDGTSNYVIFDDSLINIAERGNATVPMLATTAGLSGAGLLAPLVVDGKFQHNATKKPKVTKKEKKEKKEEKGMLSELSDALASLSWLSDKKAKLIASILVSDQLQKGLDHAEMPARGIWGTGRAVAGAASGENPSDTRRAANRIYTQPTDKTLQEAGQYVLKKTGSPAAAAATSTLGMLTDPTFWL